jgi:hypothetical protein
MSLNTRQAQILASGRVIILALIVSGWAVLLAPASGAPAGAPAGGLWACAFIVFHLVMGAQQAEAALPAWVWRWTMAGGVALALAASAFSGPASLNSQSIWPVLCALAREGGVACAVLGAICLIYGVFAGRALMLDPEAADGP